MHWLSDILPTFQSWQVLRQAAGNRLDATGFAADSDNGSSSSPRSAAACRRRGLPALPFGSAPRTIKLPILKVP